MATMHIKDAEGNAIKREGRIKFTFSKEVDGLRFTQQSEKPVNVWNCVRDGDTISLTVPGRMAPTVEDVDIVGMLTRVGRDVLVTAGKAESVVAELKAEAGW